MKKLIRKLICLVCAMILCMTQMIPVMAADTNPLASAKSLGTSGTVSGILTEENEAEYYKYIVPANTSVELNLTLTSYMDGIKVKIYNAGGNETNSDYFTADSSTKQTTENLTYYLNPGTYYIGLNRGYCDGGKYTVKFSTTELYNTDTTYDDTIASAHLIPLSTRVTGILSTETEDEIDIYRLDVIKPGIIEYDLKFYMERLRFKLLDGQGNQILSDYYVWNNNLKMGTENFSFALEKGVYYIAVERTYSNGKYIFDQRYTDVGSTEQESNDSLEQAQTIALEEKVTGILASGDDTDFFKINIPTKRNVTFNVPSKFSNLQMYIYDAEGNQIKSDYSDWNSNTNKGTLKETYKLAAGNYYIQLRKYLSSDRGTYNLTVSTTKSPTKGKIITIKRTKKNWAGNRAIYLKWAKSTNAEGYQIYVASNSKFRNADKYTTDKRTYTTWSYKSGKTYYVKIRGYRKNSDGEYIYGKFSAVKKIKL